jgi:hypothetical protein
MRVMANAPKGLIVLLVGTVAFFALWTVAFKPSSTTKSGSPTGLAALQAAANKARKAVTNANAAQAQGGPAATTPSTTAPAAATAHPNPTATGTTPSRSAVHPTPKPATPSLTAQGRVNAVNRALVQRKVVALLFYNPAASDDRAVKAELATVNGHRGKVVVLAVPLSELTGYPVVTDQVPVTESPTLVLINRNQQATTMVGFADRFEIGQRVTNALAAK